MAFGLAGGNKLVAGFFDSLRATIDDSGPGGPEGGFDSMVAEAERELGIDLPDDLAVLLGSNLVAAMRDDQAGRTQLEVGARVTTDGPRAVALVDKINKATKASGSDFPLERRLTDDGVVIASSKGQVDLLLKDGGLGDRDAVRKALPDVDGATVALWVDIRSLMRRLPGLGRRQRERRPDRGPRRHREGRRRRLRDLPAAPRHRLSLGTECGRPGAAARMARRPVTGWAAVEARATSAGQEEPPSPSR